MMKLQPIHPVQMDCCSYSLDILLLTCKGGGRSGVPPPLIIGSLAASALRYCLQSQSLFRNLHAVLTTAEVVYGLTGKCVNASSLQFKVLCVY